MVFRSSLTRGALSTAGRPRWTSGLRAALATIVPIVAGSAAGWPGALWMGLAGFNVALGDKGGALRVRFRGMFASLVWGALAAVAGGLSGKHVAAAIAVLTVWAFFAGLARVWGAIATSAGIVSLATLAVSVGYPATSAGEALQRGVASVAGGAFAMFLALAVWPVRLYRPARLDVARAYRALASGADAREELDAARMTLAALRRGLQGELPRGERLLVLVEIGDELQRKGVPAEARLALNAIAEAVEHERNDFLGAVDAGDRLVHDAIAAARELNEEPLRVFGPVDFHAEYVAPLVDALTWDSAVMRHALRVAVTTGAAVALTETLHVPRGYWLTLSVIVILQPYTSATFLKGLQRVLGTLLGGLVAALILGTIHSHAAMLAVIFIGAAVTAALLPVNYGLYSLFLTPTFVLLAEVGATDWHLIWLRAGNTAAGTALAYAAAWLLWPASERGLVREDLAAALRALAEHTRCIGECDDTIVAESRRTWIVAVQNAEASLQRYLTEREVTDQETLMALLVYARRFALALSASVNAASDRLLLRPVTQFASNTLFDISAAVATSRKPSPMGEMEGGERLIPPLTALHRAAERLGGED